MSSEEVIAAYLRRGDIGPRDAEALAAARDILFELGAAGKVVADRKLLAEAHATMRACGWQSATAAEPISDGVLDGPG